MDAKPIGYFWGCSPQRTQRDLRASLLAAGLGECTVYVAVVFPRPAAVSQSIWDRVIAKAGEPDFILDAAVLANAPTFNLSRV